MNTDMIKNYLDEIELLCNKIREDIGYGGRVQIRVNANQTSVKTRDDKIIPNKSPIITVDEQSSERARKIINDSDFPEAVPGDLLCSVASNEDLIARAEGMLDCLLNCDLTNLQFLDFGCGQGHMARQALERGVSGSVGYDIKRQGWERFRGVPNLTLVDEITSLEKESFDVILVHDVLDHCQRPIEALSQIKSLLKPHGVVYVRCHPWTSRTGGHLYQQINKAYIHLLIDDDILKSLGYKLEYIKKVLRPVKTYKEWFDQAGFTVKSEQCVEEVLENALKDNQVTRNGLIRHWDLERTRDSSLTVEKVLKILEIQFIDYQIFIN